MLEFLQREKFLKKLRKMTADELIKEYMDIRSRGSILCAVGDVNHIDIKNWVICEDYLTKTKNVDFRLLDDYVTICNALSSEKNKNMNKDDLITYRDLAKKKLLEVL